MSSTTLPIETRLTPAQSLLADEIGNEVYASHYAERKLSRFVIGTETVLLLGAFGLIFSLAHRPIANRYIRIDEMGRAQAIAYTDLNYSPREGEVRTYLTDWANYRYTLSRDTIAKKYPLNYYFLSQNLPVPTVILSTSPDKYQVLWRVGGFDFDGQESTLKLLAIAFGGDSACTDRNRVLRVPGFRNRKYDPAHPVTVEYPSDSTHHPADFRLDYSVLASTLPLHGAPGTYAASKNTDSERDWAWVVQQLSLGEDAAKLTLMLASRRSDKPNPLYYAQRTIDIASARLSLLEEVAIEDVIAMLERRRSTELPAALCSARAREIATTAQRTNDLTEDFACSIRIKVFPKGLNPTARSRL